MCEVPLPARPVQYRPPVSMVGAGEDYVDLDDDVVRGNMFILFFVVH